MTVEIIVFLGIGMILLAMLTAFVYEWKFSDNVESLEKMYQEQDREYGTKVDKVNFINAARLFWDYCNHSYANQTKIMYVYNDDEDKNGNLTKEDMFEQYRQLGWCKSIQSANHSCGKREDVNMTDIELPEIIRLRCENSTLFIFTK